MSVTVGNGQWWLEEHRDKRGSIVLDVARHIWNVQRPQREQLLLNARIYGETNLISLTPRPDRQHVAPGAKSHRACLNAVGSVVDTWVTMIVKDDVEISVQTTGADFETRERADKLQLFLDGAAQETDFDEVEQDVAFDCAKFNPGWVHFFVDDRDPENLRLGVERVIPTEILIDHQDGFYRKPRTLYRLKFRERSSLMQEFPDLAAKLETVQTEGFGEGSLKGAGAATGVDLVPVIDAYHLPRFLSHGEGNERAPSDGRHTVTVGTVVLLDEEYDEESFPFEPMWIKKPTAGIVGEGIPDALSGIQRELNVLGAKIQRCEHLMATPHWLIEQNSKVNTGQIDNQIGSMIRYQGTKPEAVMTPGVPPELFAREDKLFSRAFDVYGVSPQLAQGEAPPQLHSGEAQRVALGVASDRFLTSIKERRRFRTRCAKQFIRLARRIGEKDPSFSVVVKGEKISQVISWAEAAIDDSKIRLSPTNEAAASQEDIIDETQDFMNAGVIPGIDGMRLIAASGNRPDLQAYCEETFASRDWTEAQIGACLSGAKPLSPSAFVNVQEAQRIATARYLQAERRGAAKGRLEALSTWIVLLTEQAKKSAPSSSPPPGAPAPPPPGGPLGVASHMAPPPAAVAA